MQRIFFIIVCIYTFIIYADNYKKYSLHMYFFYCPILWILSVVKITEDFILKNHENKLKNIFDNSVKMIDTPKIYKMG